MRRVAVLLAGLLVITLPGVVAAQNFFNLPGLPSIGLFGGNQSGCGTSLCDPEPGFKCAPAVYIGYMTDRKGTHYGAKTTAPGLGRGITGLEHSYTNQGVWFGASLGCGLTNNIGFVATGWYLLPTNSTSLEKYDVNEVYAFANRTWDTDSKWWFVDGALVIGNFSGLSLLVGARYDYYGTNYSSPTVAPIFFTTNDKADLSANNVIPFVGTQYSINSAVSSLNVRAIGIPTLAGNVTYNETLGNVVNRVEGRGNWKGGYFLEVFGDYTLKMGPGEIGGFIRWNMAHGEATLDTDLLGGAASKSFDLYFDRNSWTFGGKMSLAF